MQWTEDELEEEDATELVAQVAPKRPATAKAAAKPRKAPVTPAAPKASTPTPRRVAASAGRTNGRAR